MNEIGNVRKKNCFPNLILQYEKKFQDDKLESLRLTLKSKKDHFLIHTVE